MAEKGEKLVDLDVTLIGVENQLLKRKIDRQDAAMDQAMDIINTAAENGDIDLENCDGCDDDDIDLDVEPEVNGEE